ncbi:hypothetical protein LZG04_34410 [Saccharothrix sp. S26]|uniref:hypothetical protein n=1 Tax=Saccharothrix sp. S26 TaxID=2907215 RepID=UPI001F1840EC|nr:hypothetical protein [Saccharothrix sp. S26]MCE6999870.1 hypothetical protein [Saccharothrix sp. S26]
MRFVNYAVTLGAVASLMLAGATVATAQASVDSARPAVTTATSDLIPESELLDVGEIQPLEDVSDCKFNLDWPHNSGHVAGNVTSNGVINCNSKKKYLGVETYLYRESSNPGYFKLVAQNSAVNNSGNGSYVNAAAALGCVSARYYAKAEFLMVEGNDARHERTHKTPEIQVNCS